MSKVKAARLYELAPLELELLCRIGVFRGRRGVVRVPGRFGDLKLRESLRAQLRTVGGW